jgi:hypothetical protein
MSLWKIVIIELALKSGVNGVSHSAAVVVVVVVVDDNVCWHKK